MTLILKGIFLLISTDSGLRIGQHKEFQFFETFKIECFTVIYAFHNSKQRVIRQRESQIFRS